MKKIINKISNNIYMDIRPDELRVNTATPTPVPTPTATPRSGMLEHSRACGIIKSDTIISQVVGTIDEETKTCFTRISMFFKKMVYCECQSSSNCVKNKK